MFRENEGTYFENISAFWQIDSAEWYFHSVDLQKPFSAHAEIFAKNQRGMYCDFFFFFE